MLQEIKFFRDINKFRVEHKFNLTTRIESVTLFFNLYVNLKNKSIGHVIHKRKNLNNVF